MYSFRFPATRPKTTLRETDVTLQLPARNASKDQGLKMWVEDLRGLAKDQAELIALEAALKDGKELSSQDDLGSLGPLYLVGLAIQAVEKGEDDRATVFARHLQNTEHKSLLIELAAGCVFCATGHYDEALRSLRLCRAAAKDATARNWIDSALFKIYRDFGDFKMAQAIARGLLEESAPQTSMLIDAAIFSCDLNAPEFALKLLQRAFDPMPPSRATEVIIRTAQMLHSSGAHNEAAELLTDALGWLPKESKADIADVFFGIDAFAEATRLFKECITAGLEPDKARGQLARLELARGNVAAARALVSEIEDRASYSVTQQHVLGLSFLMEGESPEAADCFESLLKENPDQSEAWFGLADAYIQLGRLEDASGALMKGGNLTDEGTSSFTYQSLALLIELKTRAKAPSPEIPQHITLYPTLLAGMDLLLPQLNVPLSSLGEEELGVQLEKALREICGSRDAQPIVMGLDRDSLQRLPETTSVRRQAKELAWRISWETTEAVLKKMRDLCLQYPRSPQPPCYLGELLLWHGRIDEAEPYFQKALELNAQAKWTYIGLGAVQLLRGEYAEARRIFDESVEVTGTPGPTLFAYRGEALYFLGEYESAHEDLKRACDAKAERIGAWVCLGLNAIAREDNMTLVKVVEHLAIRAPGLVHDSVQQAGLNSNPFLNPTREGQLDRDIFATALHEARRLLRGNRASAFVTYFTPEGALRIVNSRPLNIREDFTQKTSKIKEMILRSIAASEPCFLVFADEEYQQRIEDITRSRDTIRGDQNRDMAGYQRLLAEQQIRVEEALKVFPDDEKLSALRDSARFNHLYHLFEEAQRSEDPVTAQGLLRELVELSPENTNLKKRLSSFRYVIPPNLENEIVELFSPYTPGQDYDEGSFIRIEVRDSMIIAHVREASGMRSAVRLEHPNRKRPGHRATGSLSLTIIAQNPEKQTLMSQRIAEAIAQNDQGKFPWALAGENSDN